MSLSLSALLNPESCENKKEEETPAQSAGQEPLVSATERRESTSTTLQSPELHAQLPKYTPPQRVKSSDGPASATASTVTEALRRGSNSDAASTQARRSSTEFATHGSIELPVPNVHAARKMSSPTLEQYHVASRSPELWKASMQTSGVVLPPLQMPNAEEEAARTDKAHVKDEHHKPANQDHMDKVVIKQEIVASPQDAISADIRRHSLHADPELQTSKTLASLKHEHNSRTQSPLRESSLALPSTEDASPSMPATKKKPPPARKKGTATTARKTKATKKRKPDAKATLKTGLTRGSSAASPTPSGAGEEYDEDESMADSDEDVEGSGDVYCICRKPDNGTFMIGCDGGCDDWFHGKCVSVEERDKSLIDKYICPRCAKADIGQTSWKRICRRQGCRQPARVGKNAGKDGATSKYCSDECGVLFFRQMTASSRGADQPRRAKRKGTEHHEDRAAAKGGILSSGEVRAMLDQTNTAVELRDLGNGVLSPPATPSRTPEEAEDLTLLEKAALDKIAAEKDQARRRHQLLKDRLKLITMVKNEANRVAAEKDLKPKEYCGCDSRLEWSEEEFTAWRESSQGQQAFEKDSLEGELGGENEVCSRKKCARHTEWNKLAVDDVRNETTENSDRMRTLEHDEREIRECAASRAKARRFGGEEGSVEMHAVSEPQWSSAPVMDVNAMDVDVA